MIFTEESVNFSQLNELSARLFKVKGMINLDKNDLAYVLAGNDDCTLITARREDEDSREFMTKFTSYLASKPDVKEWRRIMMYLGYSPKHPLKVEDVPIINELLSQTMSEYDFIWGLHENPDEVGLSAVVAYNLVQ